MPTYTIQRDPPCAPARGSAAFASTPTGSKTFSIAQSDSTTFSKAGASYHPSYHAHPDQEITDHGPQIRQSRLPLFKQVRSMLHKPPPITTPSNPKWQNYTAGLNESGKLSTIQSSTYASPFASAYQLESKASPERPKKSRKDQSPVSVLVDDEITPVDEQEARDVDAELRSPVSPISRESEGEDHFEDAVDQSLLPQPLSTNVQRESQPASPSLHTIKRKPVSRCTSAAENLPPNSPQHSPSQSSDMSAPIANIEEQEEEFAEPPKSHFSWTTYAPTVAPNRHSIDTVATWEMDEEIDEPKSRFSWSTAATQPTRPESLPPTPPRIPAKYSSPPMQSILSRKRPVYRNENLEWTTPSPAARSGNTPSFATPADSTQPTSAISSKHIRSVTVATPPTSGSPSTDKALPPPPQLFDPNTLTHLETLLAQERDIILQRRNVEKGISELEKIQKASPLDVPFATVRDVKKRLAEYRTRLDEVKLEERDIGVAIARARRKDEKENGGDGETLWVRRHSSWMPLR